MKVVKREKEDGSALIFIKGDLTIQYVRKLKDFITGLFGKYNALEIDLSETGRLDSSGLQLLLYFKADKKLYGKKLIIVNPSVEVKNTFIKFGEYF